MLFVRDLIFPWFCKAPLYTKQKHIIVISILNYLKERNTSELAPSKTLNRLLSYNLNYIQTLNQLFNIVK